MTTLRELIQLAEKEGVSLDSPIVVTNEATYGFRQVWGATPDIHYATIAGEDDVIVLYLPED